jgi:hypothetical protein
MAEYDSFEDFEETVTELDIPDDAKYGFDTTTITDDLGVKYNVCYEYGNIDIEAMGDAVDGKENNFIVTSDNNYFRYRYKISTNKAGVDVYANGRVLDTNEWPFDRVRHPTLNRFNGVIRIEPASEEHQVPTNNEKTGIDKTSSLWHKLVEWLNDDSRQPQRKQYDTGSDDNDDDPSDGGDTSDTNGGDDATSTDDGGDMGGDIDTTGGNDGEVSGDDSTDSGGDGDTGDDTSDGDDGMDGEGDDGTDDDNETDQDESEQTEIDALIEQLETSAKPEDSLRSETEIDGGEIDLIHDQADGPTNLYKIVHGQARPKDVYEMMMYQDHFKRSRDRNYGQTILLCTGLTDDSQSDYDSITHRTDDHDDPYEFSVVAPETASEDLPWITE